MKKILLSLLIIVLWISTLNAQFTKVGGGTGFSSGYFFHEMNYDYNKSGHIPLFLTGIYEISLPLHISPSFTFLYPHVTKEFESKTTVTTMMLDINGHYVFNSLDRFEFYGLAGLDILLAWKKDKYTGPNPAIYKESDNAIGLNLGLGSYMKLTDQFDLFLEAKYLVSKYNQFMINAGVLINIDWLIKHENTEL